MMVDKKQIFSSALFASVVALAVIVASLYLYNIIRWGDYPDFGFGFRTATGIEVIATVTDHGLEAGVQMGDRILRVNGKTFSTIQEFRAAMNRGLGEKNSYQLERGGKEIQVHITNIPMGIKASFVTSGFLYLAGLCYALIGTVSFLMKPHQRTTWIFLLFAVTFGLLMAFGYKVGTMVPFWLETFQVFVYIFAPATLIHLGLGFPEESRILKRYAYSQCVPYLVSLVLFVWIRSLTPTITDAPRLWRIAAVAYMAAAVFFFLGSCIKRWLTSQSETAKLRAKVILLGFAITASIPLMDFLSSTLFQMYIFPSPNFYVPLFIVLPLSIAYAIIKHDLFDIDAIIKRTYGYILTTVGIAGAYGLFVLISNLAFGTLRIAESRAFPLIFILATVFLFNPVRDRVQRFIDKVFYRLEYDYQETVHKISESMRSLLKLDQVGQSIMNTALGTMFIDHGYVLLLERDGKTYDCLVEAGTSETRPSDGSARLSTESSMTCGPEVAELRLPAEEPLIQKMSETGKEVTVYDIEENPAFENSREACRRTFERMQAQLLVPLIYENRLTGLIALGRKKSGKFYRREDINLLNVLANQGAVAIENARMVQDVIDKERMEEELSIARELQVSMLPADCPQVPGYEIKAYSIAAREVGGDFYDFIGMGGVRLGMVIGDVAGKSVSGALVMSASRSVFRMLSEEELTVAARMMRANLRLKQDLKTGMFVALLYAVLDAEKRTLALCSAGQTHPVFRKAQTGETVLIETQGDNFPLGILSEAEYQETMLTISPGDVAVLYTDGIVEAMNPAGEIFGFDRLIETTRCFSGGSAESLLRNILDRVNDFTAGAPQHDDLTLIVIKAN